MNRGAPKNRHPAGTPEGGRFSAGAVADTPEAAIGSLTSSISDYLHPTMSDLKAGAEVFGLNEGMIEKD